MGGLGPAHPTGSSVQDPGVPPPQCPGAVARLTLTTGDCDADSINDEASLLTSCVAFCR